MEDRERRRRSSAHHRAQFQAGRLQADQALNASYAFAALSCPLRQPICLEGLVCQVQHKRDICRRNIQLASMRLRNWSFLVNVSHTDPRAKVPGMPCVLPNLLPSALVWAADPWRQESTRLFRTDPLGGERAWPFSNCDGWWYCFTLHCRTPHALVNLALQPSGRCAAARSTGFFIAVCMLACVVACQGES